MPKTPQCATCGTEAKTAAKVLEGQYVLLPVKGEQKKLFFCKQECADKKTDELMRQVHGAPRPPEEWAT